MTRTWQDFLRRVDEVRGDLPNELTHRPMFVGAMLYADGRPIASLSDVGFAVKLPTQYQAELLDEPGTTRLRYQPSSPESRSYIVLSEAILADDDAFVGWIQLAAHHATSVPRRQRRAGTPS